MFLTALFTILSLAFTASADNVLIPRSPISMSLARKVNLTSVHNLVRHDVARARHLKAKGLAKASGGLGLFNREADAVVSSSLDNQAVSYVAAIAIGSPFTVYNLLVDTGSSNTWVGAGTAFVKTSTSVQTSNKVAVTYGSGSFSGNEFTDQLVVACSVGILGQSIGIATTSSGFEGLDGILGLGPADLTAGTLSPATASLIPTIVDNLFASGLLSANEIGISFAPTTSLDVVNGELTWGGTDSSQFTGSIGFTPVTATSPSSEFWGINQSVRYSTSTAILSTTAGIVDTGTTLILLATDGFKRYQTATGAVLDNTTGLLRLTAAQFANLKSLFFTTSAATYELTANAQIWPRALNTDIGGTSTGIYLIVADLGSPSGEGFDFVNGFAFLERFYSVFDTANKRVGLATTPFTTATTN